MANLESYNGRKKSNHSLPKFKNVMEKLQKGLKLGRRLSLPSGSSSRWSWETFDRDNGEFDDNGYKDVPEVAVIVLEGEELKGFVIPITYLANPKFVMQLEEASEEYGFYHVGALPIPCRPSELEKILIICSLKPQGLIVLPQNKTIGVLSRVFYYLGGRLIRDDFSCVKLR